MKDKIVLAPFIDPISPVNLEPRPDFRVGPRAVDKLGEIARSMLSSTGKPSKTPSKV